MRPLILTLTAATLAAGCQLLGFGGQDEDDHRKVWASKNDGSYSYVLNRGCFCWPAGEFQVQVIDYRVVNAYDVLRQQPLDTTLYQYVETIEDMFDLIDRAREQHADELRVEYSRDGYPKTLAIDWFKQAADDEIYLSVSDVRIGVAKVD